MPELEDEVEDRARPVVLPALGATLRLAASDVYFNSWRLAPANLVWGAVLIVALLAGPMSIIGLVALVALGLPTAGLHRMAALISRGQPAAFSDFVDGMRRGFGPALVVAGGGIALGLVLITNILVGFQSGSPVGWFVSAMALWGLVALGMALVAFWPLLGDPNREGLGLWRRLALAGIAVVGRPRRMAAITLAVTVILAISTVLFAALLVVSVAYVAVLTSRYVLPTVDELEGRLRR
ncbi:MAG TPA: hypothetical protein VM451_00240 [Candidatus Limnocylindria bacterium]|nr:hypothetical protein [Candidatus Limnocylindria bacterium]